MENKKSKKKRAHLFNPKLFPMDLARILCAPAPAFFNIKKIYTSEKAKKKLKGGMIIVANHTCIKDPLMISCCFWYRRMFHLTAEAVMAKKIKALALKGVGCIKINRNICDIESVRKAVDIVKKGHVLTIFPQGGIKADEDINSIKSGVVLMAMQAKSPIVPCYIHNKKDKNDHNCIVIGEPIELFSKSGIAGLHDINKCASDVIEKMAECKAVFEQTRSDLNGNN